MSPADAATTRFEVAPTDAGGFEAGNRLGVWLSGIDCPSDTAHDARLVVVELVDNAARHTRDRAIVNILFADHRLRIEVHDTSSRPPILATPSANGGFGLAVVDALADTWGWEPADYGKRVWAELLC